MNGTPADHLDDRAEKIIRPARPDNTAAAATLDALDRAAAQGDDSAGLHFSRGVALHQLGRPDQAVNAYLRAAELDQTNADIFLNLGNALTDLNRLTEALEIYQVAAALRPDWPLPLTNIGVILKDLGRCREALDIQAFLVSRHPEFQIAHTNLGFALQRLSRHDEAVAAFRRAAELAPDSAGALANLAQALQMSGDDPAAGPMFRRALAMAPDHPQIHYNHAHFLLLTGQFAEGWAEYEWRWRGGLKSLKRGAATPPRWDGTPLGRRTLLLHAEQGLGDTLQFVRFAGKIPRQGGRVVLEAPASLHPLLTGVAGIDSVVAAGSPLPPADLSLPLMSLPAVLGGGESLVRIGAPYLRADPALTRTWDERLRTACGRRRIAVAWAGNPRHKGDALRSIPAAALLDRVGDGRLLISLQKDLRNGDAQVLEARSDRVVALGADLASFADTAAILATIDLLITVDSVLAHLAGALGRPAWVLIPHVPDWRWQRVRTDSPWYPSLRLFRQDVAGDWTTVLDRVALALAAEKC